MADKTILVIEDDEDVRRALNMLLRAQGYKTVFAEDGMGAIQLARKHEPDLVLLDLGLPAGDGFVVLERFSRNTELSAIPVVVVSAREAANNEERAKKAGAVEYVQKPVDSDELLEAIARAVA